MSYEYNPLVEELYNEIIRLKKYEEHYNHMMKAIGGTRTYMVVGAENFLGKVNFHKKLKIKNGDNFSDIAEYQLIKINGEDLVHDQKK